LTVQTWGLLHRPGQGENRPAAPVRQTGQGNGVADDGQLIGGRQARQGLDQTG